MFTTSQSRRSWAIRTAKSFLQRTRKHSQRRRRRSSEPEQLEDRALLATFVVTNTLDQLDGAGDPIEGSLRWAIQEANDAADADDIQFSIPAINPTITLDEGAILIDDELIINGVNTVGGTVTVSVDATAPSRIFSLDNTIVTINELTMADGFAEDDGVDATTPLGGAILSELSTLTINDSLFDGNRAEEAGGAIYMNQGSLTVTGTEFSQNRSDEDGGAVLSVFANTIIETSTFTSNRADRDGGGVYLQGGGQVLVDRTEFVQNLALDDGGAIYNTSTFLVTGSTFDRNDADRGGAAFNNGSLEMVNSTLSGNTADAGGGVFNDFNLTVTNSTLTDNFVTALNRGGGIFTESLRSTYLFNTLVAGNTSGFGDDDLNGEPVNTASNNNLVGDADTAGGLIDTINENIVGVDGVGVIPIAEVIEVALEDNGGPTRTHQILEGGLAYDAGDDNRAAFAGPDFIPDIDMGDTALENDQRGEFPYRRIFDGAVDIGAFEQQPLLVSEASDVDDGDFTDGRFSLVEAIAVANSSATHNTIAFDIQTPSLDIPIDTQLEILTPITIDGTNRAEQGGYMVLDGQNDGRIFWVVGAELNLRNITLANGWANGSDPDTTDSTGVDLDFAGGAILNQGGSIEVRRTGFSSNRADGSGGAIYSTDLGSSVVVNSTLSGNEALVQGGALHNQRATMSIVNSTITGNDSGLAGGGVFTAPGGSSLTHLYNSIVADNDNSFVPQDVAGANVQAGAANNIIGSSASAGGIVHGVAGNIVGNSGLGSLDITTVLETTAASNGGPHLTHALVPNSPALNAGDNDRAAHPGDDFIPDVADDEPLISDGRDFPFVRAFDGTTDIGAYEEQVLTIAVNSVEDELDVDFSFGDFSLREAVRFSNENPAEDVIQFDLPGTPTLEVFRQLVVTNDVIFDGSNLSGDDVTLDGLGDRRLFNIDATAGPVTAAFSRMTFTNGNANGADGGLTPESGGAILSRFGTVELLNTTFRNNQASDSGGAIYIEDGVLIMNQSTVDNNVAAVIGGGIVNDDGSVDIIDSTISNNEAAVDGGGIFNNNGPLSLVNSTLSGNRANVSAGGIYNEDDTVVIVNSTIVNNVADADGNGTGEGGGMVTVDDSVTFTNMFNNIIAGNTAGTTPSDLAGKTPEAISSNNLIGDAATSAGLVDGENGHIVGDEGTGTIALASILNPTLTNNGGPVETHALAVGSPAIDGGDSNRAAIPGANSIPDISGDGDTAITFDQRGFPYQRNFVDVDMGSYEVTRGWIVDTTDDIDNGDYSAGDLSLREAVFLANATPATVTIGFDIAVADPTITLTGTQLEIVSNIIIDGTNTNASGGEVTVTSTGGRLFFVNGVGTPASLGLTNITLDGGHADGTDAAPFEFEGGAILNQSGDLWLDDVVVSNNRANEDGGAIMSRSGTVQVWNSTFHDNAGRDGGALYNFGATTTITDTTMYNNTAARTGGALLVRNGTVDVVASTLRNNFAVGNGGAAGTEITASLHVTNSTVSGNSARGAGGGFHSDSGFIVLTNTTVTQNLADSDANGIGGGGGVWTGLSGGTRLFNTIVAGNVVSDTLIGGGTQANDLDGSAVISASSNNLIGNAATAGGLVDGTNDNIVGNSGAGTIPINSILNTTLALNGGSTTESHALVTGSLAIDGGDDNRAALPGSNGIPDAGGDGDVGLLFDQRATPHARLTGTVDIGSYEVTTGWNVDVGGDTNDGDFTPGNFSLREAIDTANASPGTDTITFDIGMSRSSIALSGGEIVVSDDLIINGLGASSLSIDAGGLSRIMHVMPGVTLTINNLTLTGGNSSAAGGAILSEGTLNINDSALTNNVAVIGGALKIEGAANITRTEISGNRAQYGGGIASDASQMPTTLRDVTVSTNRATAASGSYAGAGLYVADAVFNLFSSTIAFNRSDANAEGAGIAIDPAQLGTLNLVNSIVSNNITTATGVDVAGHISRMDHSLTGTNAGYTRVDNGGNAEGFDPMLEPLAVYNGQTATHQLGTNSPAVNSGNNAEVAPGAFDQTQQPRESGTTDMGADELLIRATDDSFLVVAGTSVVMPVLNNDSPSNNVEIRGVSDATRGTTAITGSDITYTSNGTAGLDSFTYEIGTATQKATGTLSSESGHVVDVDGDWMVTGAPFDSAGDAEAGAAIVYRRVGSTWVQHQVLTAFDATPRDQFGWDVAVEGTTIVVGSRKDDDFGTDSGSAYVFEFDANQGLWINSAKLNDVTGREKDQFGHSVAVQGDTIVVGARLDDGRGTNGGSIFIFNRTASGWTTAGETKNTDQVKGDQFGYDVAIDGNLIAVGARKDNSGGIDSGSVYIYEDIGGTWTPVKEIFASNTRRNNWYGHAVDLSGGTLAVGMPQRFSRFRTGEVHIHEMDAGGADNWGETALIVDPGVDTETDRFGFAVAIDGDNLAIGATRDDTVANNAGMVYLHGRNTGGAGTWGQVEAVPAADGSQNDSYGHSVALDGDTFVIGAPLVDLGTATKEGAIYVHDFRTDSATVSVTVAAPLLATFEGSGTTDELTIDEVTPLFEAAREYWLNTPLTSSQQAALDAATFSITSLDGLLLGLEAGGQILIDDDAAGHGWDVERTASDSDGMHLLTTLTHELGHSIGKVDIYDSAQSDDIMFGYLSPGESRVDAVAEDTDANDMLFSSLANEESELLFW